MHVEGIKDGDSIVSLTMVAEHENESLFLTYLIEALNESEDSPKCCKEIAVYFEKLANRGVEVVSELKW